MSNTSITATGRDRRRDDQMPIARAGSPEIGRAATLQSLTPVLWNWRCIYFSNFFSPTLAFLANFGFDSEIHHQPFAPGKSPTPNPLPVEYPSCLAFSTPLMARPLIPGDHEVPLCLRCARLESDFPVVLCGVTTFGPPPNAVAIPVSRSVKTPFLSHSSRPLSAPVNDFGEH